MKIAVLGTGLMGAPLARRLMAKGHALTVWNRTKAKTEALAAAGATVAATPAEALSGCEVALLMLGDYPAIRETVLTEEGIAAIEGRTVIQMGTISPDESRTLRDQVVTAGGDYLEAPVLGSAPQVQTGMLAVMVGGEPHQLDKWKKMLDCLGDVTLVGPVGRAASLKLALNQLIGSLVTAFATSLVFAQREGVPTDLFLRVLRGSALYAQAFDKKLPKMESHEFGKPNFTTSLLLKDLELFVKAAQWDKVDVRNVEAVCELLRRAIQMGHGDDDYSSVFVAVERAPGS